MPFGQLWKKNGDQIVPTSGVDTIRIPDTGEYATLTRSSTQFIIEAAANGQATLLLRSGLSGDIAAFQSDSTGIGFFGATPVAQQSKVASPAADPAQIVTAFDELQTLLANYGLLS